MAWKVIETNDTKDPFPTTKTGNHRQIPDTKDNKGRIGLKKMMLIMRPKWKTEDYIVAEKRERRQEGGSTWEEME